MSSRFNLATPQFFRRMIGMRFLRSFRLLQAEFILICALAVVFVSLGSNAYATQPHEPRSQASDWTEEDWDNWWINIENLYLSGLEDEGLYWLLRHDLEVLGQNVDAVGELDIPPPYSGWAGDGPNPPPPGYIKSSSHKPVKSSYGESSPKYGQYPQEWEQLIIDHGLDPADFGGSIIPPPPLWVAAGMVALGGILEDVTHPGTKVVGKIMAHGGATIIVWITLEEEREEDDQ